MPPGCSTSALICVPSGGGAGGIVGMGMHRMRPASRRPASGMNSVDLELATAVQGLHDE